MGNAQKRSQQQQQQQHPQQPAAPPEKKKEATKEDRVLELLGLILSDVSPSFELLCKKDASEQETGVVCQQVATAISAVYQIPGFTVLSTLVDELHDGDDDALMVSLEVSVRQLVDFKQGCVDPKHVVQLTGSAGQVKTTPKDRSRFATEKESQKVTLETAQWLLERLDVARLDLEKALEPLSHLANNVVEGNRRRQILYSALAAILQGEARTWMSKVGHHHPGKQADDAKNQFQPQPDAKGPPEDAPTKKGYVSQHKRLIAVLDELGKFQVQVAECIVQFKTNNNINNQQQQPANKEAKSQ